MLQLLEAKASLSLAQSRHALQLQQAKAQMNKMVPKKQFEQLQASLREEQSRARWLQENLHRQAEQAHRQLLRTQVSEDLQLSHGCQRERCQPGRWLGSPEVWVEDAAHQEPP